MKVLFALNSYEEDGPGLLVFRLCQRLAPLGEVRLSTVALSRGGPLIERYRGIGVPAEVVPTRGRGGVKRLKVWAGQLALRADKPDLVHSHLLWPDLAVRLVHRQLGGVPLVSTCHGMHAVKEKGALAGVVYGLLDSATRGRCSAWIAVSEQTRREMIAVGYPATRIHVVRNGVDCLQFFPLPEHRRLEVRALLNVEPDAPLIVAAGNLIKLKGHDLLIRTMPLILREHPRARLFIFGEGPEKECLEELIRVLNLGDSVKLIGRLSETMPQVLSAADVVVHPSHIEAFGLVVAEAQACGTPVVATNRGGIPEVVQDGATGYLVEPLEQEIGGRVNELLANPEKRAAMGSAAREYVNANHEIGRTAEGYLALWKSVAGES